MFNITPVTVPHQPDDEIPKNLFKGYGTVPVMTNL
jgi:hypothetical protein